MTREEMIDAAFAGEEIGDVTLSRCNACNGIFDDQDLIATKCCIDGDFCRACPECGTDHYLCDTSEINDDDDDEEFSRFIAESLSRKPKRLSGAAKMRVRKLRNGFHRSLRQPPVLHPLEAFVLERGK